MELSSETPVFGQRLAGERYIVRPSAYALIHNERGEVAVVATPFGIFLPGGGIERDETPEQAIERETLEECGLLVGSCRVVAHAIQFAYSMEEQVYFEKRCVFATATVTGVSASPGEADHELRWLPADAAAGLMVHECHAWALLAPPR